MKKFRNLFSIILISTIALMFNSCKKEYNCGIKWEGTNYPKSIKTKKDKYCECVQYMKETNQNISTCKE